MSYRRDLKRLRRARKLAKRQQHWLATLELADITAITLHTHDKQLTIAIERNTGVLAVDILREVLLDRRHTIRAETQQLRQDWQESEALCDQRQAANSAEVPQLPA